MWAFVVRSRAAVRFPAQPVRYIRTTRSVSSESYQQRRQQRKIETAKRTLGVLSSHEFQGAKDLRLVYLEAAKLCHPDIQDKEDMVGDSHDFCEVTEAYEFLQTTLTGRAASLYDITKEEEEAFRSACQDWLGVSAEVVEESKKCPMFRDWLSGRSESAQHWRSFFSINGGLAPMLQKNIAGFINRGTEPVEESTTTPRRRKRR